MFSAMQQGPRGPTRTNQAKAGAADNGARVADISDGGVAASSPVKSAAKRMRSMGGVVVVVFVAPCPVAAVA